MPNTEEEQPSGPREDKETVEGAAVPWVGRIEGTTHPDWRLWRGESVPHHQHVRGRRYLWEPPQSKTDGETPWLLPSSDPLLFKTPNAQTSPKQSSGKRKTWKSLVFLEIQKKPVIFRRNLPSGLGLRNKKYKKCAYFRNDWGKTKAKRVFFTQLYLGHTWVLLQRYSHIANCLSLVWCLWYAEFQQTNKQI